MRVAVIGAGAMGSLVSFLLHAAGAEIVVYERRQERIDELRARGINVRGDVKGEAFPVIGLPGEDAEPYDLMVLAVRAGDTGDALRPLSPYVHRDTVYLSLQEGDAVSDLGEMVGEERAFAAIAWASAVEILGGDIEVEELRSLVLGGLSAKREVEIVRIAGMLGEACPCEVRLAQDLSLEIWRRLEAVAAVSGLCALSGLLPEEARKMDDLNEWCEEAAEECRKTAASTGLEISGTGSPWEDAVWRGVQPPLMHDIMADRGTEVAWLSGDIVEQARMAGIPVPVHNSILSLVREIESGRHRPGERSLRELKRRIAEEKGMTLI
jgi:2-dehydropantoate 2-reductase